MEYCEMQTTTKVIVGMGIFIVILLWHLFRTLIKEGLAETEMRWFFALR
jgi:hypothetical protein